MANLTADRILRMYGLQGRQIDLPVGGTIFKGSMVSVLTADGEAVVTGTALSGACKGVALHGAVNDGRVIIETDCVHIFDNDTTNAVTEANLVGAPLYAVDDHTVSDTKTVAEPVAGYFAGMEPDGRVRVYIPLPAEVSLGAVSVASTVVDRTALKAIAAAARYEGQVVTVQSDYSMWVFDADNAGTTDTAEMLLIEPTAGTGAWLRADKSFIMKIPIAFGNTDGQAIETIPAGFALRITAMPFWQVTTAWTGGSSSAIGLSTNITNFTTAGDLLGGAAGDVTALLGTTGVKAGTIGDEMNTEADHQALIFVAGSEIQFDRITSAFTAGAGFACIPVVQVQV